MHNTVTPFSRTNPPTYDSTVTESVLFSIIVPCFNEAEVLPEFHRKTLTILKAMNVPFELLYVNDGSEDQTQLLIDQYAQRRSVRALHLSRNFGKESAMNAGIDYAKGQAIIFMDADLQDPPEFIPEMINAWLDGHDIVNMKRKGRQGDTATKKLTAKLYYRLMKKLNPSFVIPEQVSDFRLIGPKPLAALKAMPERMMVMKGMIPWLGFNTTEILYDRVAREAGQTKWNYWGLIDLAVEGIISFSKKPIRWYSLSAAFITVLTTGFIALDGLINGWGLNHLFIGLLAFLSLGIGLIGEYIGAVLIETKQRPSYLISRFVERKQDSDAHSGHSSNIANHFEEGVDHVQ